jgi:protein TonB
VAPTPPQAPTKTKGPERLTVSEPTYAQRSTPVYPYEARRRHEEGIVALELFIDAQGNLEKAVVTKSSGYPILDAAATEAMRQSRFEPARVAGMGVPSKATATITFRLE